jgi:hypothetical protein
MAICDVPSRDDAGGSRRHEFADVRSAALHAVSCGSGGGGNCVAGWPVGKRAIGYQAQGEEAGVRERRHARYPQLPRRRGVRGIPSARSRDFGEDLSREAARIGFARRRGVDAALGVARDAGSVARLAAVPRWHADRLSLLHRGGWLLYSHVGHDPAYNDLSPGAVLQVEAMRDLFAARDFARFDFTEGEGQHKRQFSTSGTACVDVLLLRTTLANRVAVAALRTFDQAMAAAKRASAHPMLKRIANKIRRQIMAANRCRLFRHPDESQDPEPRSTALVTLGPDFRQDDGC